MYQRFRSFKGAHTYSLVSFIWNCTHGVNLFNISFFLSRKIEKNSIHALHSSNFSYTNFFILPNCSLWEGGGGGSKPSSHIYVTRKCHQYATKEIFQPKARLLHFWLPSPGSPFFLLQNICKPDVTAWTTVARFRGDFSANSSEKNSDIWRKNSAIDFWLKVGFLNVVFSDIFFKSNHAICRGSVTIS